MRNLIDEKQPDRQPLVEWNVCDFIRSWAGGRHLFGLQNLVS